MDLNNRLDQSLDDIISENRKSKNNSKNRTEMGKRPKNTHRRKPEATTTKRRTKNKGGLSSNIASRLGTTSKPTRPQNTTSSGRIAKRVGKQPINAAGKLAGIAGGSRKPAAVVDNLKITIKGEAGPATVFISNLDSDASTEDVKACFKQFGVIKNCTLLYDRTGKASGHAEVTYNSKQAAEACVKRLNNALADGHRLSVRLMPTPTAGGGGQEKNARRRSKKNSNRMEVD